VAVKEAVSDPDVSPCGGVAQLSLTHPTLKGGTEKERTGDISVIH